MTKRRILITGASGCIGHYLCETLIQQTDDELFLVVRDPSKLKVPLHHRAGVHLVQADLRELDALQALLATIHCAILVATSWGDPDLDITKTLELIQSLNPNVCQQVIYFSTASILRHDATLLPEAKTLGTEYIKAKATCYEALTQMALQFPVFTLFPTLVVGGDRHKPLSHFSAGLPEVLKWTGLLRFFKAEGSFHFIHAQDIATVVLSLVQHPEQAPAAQMVLGNAPVSVNEAIATLCAVTGNRIYAQINLTPWLIQVLIRLFRIQMGAWDYFCLNHRHFQYAKPVSPQTFGQVSYCPTLKDVLALTTPPGNTQDAPPVTP